MKYALLVYAGTAREAIGRLSDDERGAVMDQYRELAQAPGVFSTEQLHPAETATTVRVEGGQCQVSDGSIVNEDIAGLYLVEADHIDRAVELAEQIPAARLGGFVEVRPIVER